MNDRLVTLRGSINFRDFGGYPASAGATVRRALLFRCGHLAHLDGESRDRIEALGIGVVCDLRREDERALEPSALAHGRPRQVHIPMDPDRDVAQIVPLDDRVAMRAAYMCAINRALIVHHTAGYARLFETLIGVAKAKPAGGLLVHCTAGKDRTGIACALVLLALGVSRADVLADYLMTNETIDFENFLLPRLRREYADPGIDLAEARRLSGVRPQFLTAALDEIDARYGAIDEYLASGLGVTAAHRRCLEDAYLA